MVWEGLPILDHDSLLLQLLAHCVRARYTGQPQGAAKTPWRERLPQPGVGPLIAGERRHADVSHCPRDCRHQSREPLA